jgi:hypothetical protein
LVGDEFAEPVAIFARVAIDAADFGKFFAVRLADVEDIGGAKVDSR